MSSQRTRRDPPKGWRLYHSYQMPENLIPRSAIGLINHYCDTAPISESTAKVRKRQLLVFFLWCYDAKKPISNLTEDDIIAYKHHLLNRNKVPVDEKKVIRGYNELILRESLPDVRNQEKTQELFSEQTKRRTKSSLLQPYLRPKTQDAYLIAVRSFFAWLEAKGIGKDVAKNVKPTKRNSRTSRKHVKQHLTVDQCTQLLDACKDDLRTYAICNLMLRTGLREVEVSRIQMQDFQFLKDAEGKDVRVLYVQSKGVMSGKDEFVIISDKTWYPIMNYIAAFRKKAKLEEYLFISNSNRSKGKPLTTLTIRVMIKEVFKKIGLGDDARYSVHSLRHTFAVNYLKQSGNIYALQIAMRHSNPATTEIYLESIKDELRLTNPIESKLDSLF